MSIYLSAIGTSVPKNKVSQQHIADFMSEHLATTEEDRKNIALLYRASGIRSRYSVISDFGLDKEQFSFFPQTHELTPFPSVSKRMALYEKEALPLAIKAIHDCFSKTSVNSSQVTHLITVSCTGLYAPGLDIQIIEKLKLPTTTERTCINFMGCYAAFNALKIASAIIGTTPTAKVLIVALELCSIHLQQETDIDSLLSGALFGDGAAAVLVESEPRGIQLELKSFHSDLALEAKSDMSWKVGDFGFKMVLSNEVPDTIKKGIGMLTQRLLDKVQLTTSDIDFYAIHPGGRRILEVIEQALGITKEDNAPAYNVLRHYGNMSSPTVLFVIQSLMETLTMEDHEKHVLSFAFGPGLTLEGLLLKVTAHA